MIPGGPDSKPGMPEAARRSRRRVFLCHAFEDKPRLRKLHEQLKSDGFDPWFDEEDLLPGQKWRDAISIAIRDAGAVLVCLSKRSVSKAGYVQAEIKTALEVADEQPEGRLYLIPVKPEEYQVLHRLRDSCALSNH